MKVKLSLLSSATKKIDKPIALVVYQNRNERITIKTGISVPESSWLASSQKVINHPKADIYNFDLNKQLINASDLAKQVIISNDPRPLQSIKVLLSNQSIETSQNNFWTFCTESLNNSSGLELRTILSHRQTINIGMAYNASLSIYSLTEKFVQDFDAFLRSKKYAKSTIWNHHKNIKIYINKAIKHGILSSAVHEHPYRFFQNKKDRKTTRDYLCESELKQIETCKLPPYLEVYRDMFLFLCYTGLRISDFTKMSKSDYKNGILTITPQKTDSFATSVSLPLKKLYNGAPDRVWAKYGYDFKPYDNMSVKINYNIKLIAEFAVVDKKLSCHVARHTFLTDMARRTGNLFKVMKLGGIRKPETAMIYIHLAEMDSGALVQGINWD